MTMAPEVGTSRVFVVVNAKSGNSSPEQVRKAWEAHQAEGSGEYRIHEPGEGEDILAIVRGAVAEGFDTVVAAGGDGTVSAVANGLIGSEARLGIIPLGTANVLARELGIPIALDDACAVFERTQHDHKHRRNEGERHSLLHADRHWRRRGHDSRHDRRAQALAGQRGVHLDGGDPVHRVSAAPVLDRGRRPRARPRALQVVLANCGSLGTSGLRWGPDVRVDDGQIDVCILRAQTLLNFLSVGWSVVRGRHREDRNIQLLTARRAVAVHTDRPLPVQGDGEVIGETPLEVQVVPRALRVIVPVNQVKN